MAKNEPNMPDEIKTGPANELPTDEKAAPVVGPVGVGDDTPPPRKLSQRKQNCRKQARLNRFPAK